MKNDHTYEYRVFTNRLIDVEAMEGGKCTSKVVKELKPKDKVDGRFFHTSDTGEWFFCWNGELQKLNLKGDADVTSALAEVEKLIADAKVAVEDAKKTASEAKDAADAATSAVESIENKADKSVVEELVNEVSNKADVSAVEELSNTIEAKADKSVVDEKADKSVVEELVNEVSNKADVSVVEELSKTIEVKADKSVVDEKADKSVVEELSQKVNKIPSVEEIALKSEIPSMDEYITEEELSGKSFATTEYVGQQIANIEIPTVPTNISEFTNDAGYLNKSDADKLYAPIGSASDGAGSYATQDFVKDEIAKINIPTVPTNVSAFTNDAGYLTEHQDISGKQDVISDLETIRSGAAAGATALQEVPAEYVTESELTDKGYLTEQSLNGYATESFVSEEIKKIVIPDVPNMDDYYTKGDIDTMIGNINTMIGQATEITNTILNA